MSVTNREIADRLREIHRLMQLAGVNRFKAIAFDRAAQTIEAMDEPIAEYIAAGTLTDIKGIGSSIADDITSYAETGRIGVLEELREQIPAGVIKWLDISGLGPKNIARIHDELGITEMDELKEACRDGRVASLDGLGEKSAAKILKSIEWMQQYDERCRLDQAEEAARPFLELLRGMEEVQRLEVAGSLRRSCETIGDVDLLAAADPEAAEKLFGAFTGHERVVEVLGRGDTKSSVRTAGGRQVDLRVVAPNAFPAALLYFTGSKNHNVALRGRARERGLSLNEYGLFQLDGEGETDFERPVDFSSEEDLYRRLDLHFVPPELREDRGEVDWYAEHGSMPLVEEEQIRGVLHAHSTWSDGKYSIREMAEACMERGYGYLAITDHSRSAAYAGGLSAEEVRRQWEEIDELNRDLEEEGKDFRIFKGIESDILGDGALDYPDELLEGFELVIASVHSALDQPREKMTGRLLRAVEHPLCDLIGHPTGRLLLRREASDVDLDKLIDRAAECCTAIEINANPRRLDLDWRFGNRALKAGLMTSVNPDAHSVEGIDHIRYGVRIARKGRFGPERVLNTKGAEELAVWLSERRAKASD
ncbi:MAG: DNA polymerase/3'-5' exonuclease PolX [Balneolaceae bacterium]|nr:DNA polymerase/3'-5' exonuclease PolX [Balneolaceae bacterium]